MKNLLRSKLIRNINKILGTKSIKELSNVKRNNFDRWDSLSHLQIIFLLEKNLTKKKSINRLNKIATGKELIKIVDDN